MECLGQDAKPVLLIMSKDPSAHLPTPVSFVRFVVEEPTPFFF